MNDAGVTGVGGMANDGMRVCRGEYSDGDSGRCCCCRHGDEVDANGTRSCCCASPPYELDRDLCILHLDDLDDEVDSNELQLLPVETSLRCRRLSLVEMKGVGPAVDARERVLLVLLLVVACAAVLPVVVGAVGGSSEFSALEAAALRRRRRRPQVLLVPVVDVEGKGLMPSPAPSGSALIVAGDTIGSFAVLTTRTVLRLLVLLQYARMQKIEG